MSERQVAVLDHVFDLPLHCNAEQRYEVHHEDWPKHWNIETVEECAHYRYQRRSSH